MSKNNENTELVKADFGFAAIAGSNFYQTVNEELDGLEVSFERIKIPSGGATVFELPGEDGEPESVKEFSAVILCHQTLNVRYDSKYTGGNAPPDCSSLDGITGIGDPGGNYKSCPFNQFGSGENGAKACKNRRRIYLLRENECFPMMLSLPTGSLKAFTKYLQIQLSKGRASNSVVTKFSLKKVANKSGIVFSQAVFTLDRVLTPDEYAAIQVMTAQVKEYTAQIGFEADAVSADEESDS